MPGYADIKKALAEKDAKKFEAALKEAEEFEIIVTPGRTVEHSDWVSGTPGHYEEKIETDSSGTQMSAGNVWVDATDGYENNWTENIPERREKRILKTSDQVFNEGLRQEKGKSSFTPDEKMSHLLDMVFAEGTEGDPVPVLAAVAQKMFPNNEQTFLDKAQARVGDNQVVRDRIYDASPDGKKFIKQNSDWANFREKWEPKVKQVVAMVDWLKDHGYISVDKKGNMTAIPGPHNGMNDIAASLVKQDVNYNEMKEHVQGMATMAAGEGMGRVNANDFAYIDNAWKGIDKAITQKQEKGMFASMGRQMKDTFTRPSSSSSVQPSHTGSTREMFTQWDTIRSTVGVTAKQGVKNN